MQKRILGFVDHPSGKLNLFPTAGCQDASHPNHFGKKKKSPHNLITFQRIYLRNAPQRSQVMPEYCPSVSRGINFKKYNQGVIRIFFIFI